MEILQAKLIFPSKLILVYLKHTNKLILINNCQFWQCCEGALAESEKAGLSYAPQMSIPLNSVKFFQIN